MKNHRGEKMQQISSMLEQKRAAIKREMKEKEKEWAKKLLKVKNFTQTHDTDFFIINTVSY